MVSVSFGARIDYRSLSCTRIDRIPLSSESLSRQSTQSTVHTAVPGDLIAMGKILRRSVSYGKQYSDLGIWLLYGTGRPASQTLV